MIVQLRIQELPSPIVISRLALRLGLAEETVFKDFILSDVAKTFKLLLMGHTPVGETTKRRRGGTAKRSWHISSITGTEATFENTATSDSWFPYPVVLESGSIPGSKPWPRPGPRTMLGANEVGEPRIYSRQAPGGISRPAFAKLDTRQVLNSVERQLRAIIDAA